MNPYPFERKKTVVGSIEITYVTTGALDRPPLLFLHNGGGDHRCWAYQLWELEKDFHCVAVDLPGFGESTRVETPYTVEFLADHVSAFIDDYFGRTHPGAAVALVGHCIGASTAIEMASRTPGRFSKLTLVNVCGGLPGMGRELRSFYQWMPKSRTALSALFRVFGFLFQSRSVQEASLKQLFLEPDSKKNECVFFESHVSAKQIQFINRRNLILGMSSFSKFSGPFEKSSLTQPIQIIWGRNNEVMVPEYGKKLADYLGVQVVWMEKSKHMPMSEEPEKFNAALRQHLQVS